MVDPADEPTQLIVFDFSSLFDELERDPELCPPELPPKLPPELPPLDLEGPVVHLVGGLAFRDDHAKRVGLSLPELRPRP